MKTIRILLAALGCLCLTTTALRAQVPQLLNYQGRVAVGTTNFNGTGQFKFALVNAAGTTTYWRNSPDTTPADGVPDSAVSLTVTKGLYSILLGDTSVTNMAAIPASVWANADVRLRVWFNDGTNGSQLLTPDQRIVPSAYLADGAVTSTKIGAGAVTNTQLAPNAVQAANIASGAVDSTKIANVAVSTGNLANGSVTAAKLGSDVGLWSATGVDVFRSTGNVGIGTSTPGQKLSVAGTLESTSGGFKFPDGSVQTKASTDRGVAPPYGEAFVISKDGSGNTIAYETATRQIAFSSSSTSQVLQQVHDAIAPGHKIVVKGDLTLTATITITKQLSLDWNGTLQSNVPAGSATFVLGASGANVSSAKFVFGNVFGNSLNDFMRMFNATFNDITVANAGLFKHIFRFEQGPGTVHAQNIFRYTVLSNSSKAFYFPSPAGGSPAFGEGNQMMGGAIFGCGYGIHAESGTDCGGMTIQGVIDNGIEGTKDYWNESDINPGIGSTLMMSFIRYNTCRLYPADILINAFGPFVLGLGGIELGNPRQTATYLDFHRAGETNPDYNVRLANYEDGTLTANADRFAVSGDLFAQGSFEVGDTYNANAVAFIDFHRFGGNPDYDVRLINEAPRTLTVDASRLHVSGTLSAITKQFRIDHPLDPEHKDLVHSTVESAEMKNLYDGIAELDEHGDAWIELPLWFEALNERFRYCLTAIGASMPNLYIGREVVKNSFQISGGEPFKRVSWQVTGVRKDTWAKANPLIVEQPKGETTAVKARDARTQQAGSSKSEVGPKANGESPRSLVHTLASEPQNEMKRAAREHVAQ